MPLKVIIVDDEKYAISELKYLLTRYSDFKICGEATDAGGCLMLVAEYKPDVVFLDIELQDKNGVEVAKSIKKISSDTHIVFATAYSHYAVDAFEVQAFDYILKPFEDQRIIDTINRINNYIKPKGLPEVITVWKNDRMVVLSPKDIVYCSILDEKTVIKSIKGEFTTNLTLSSLENKLQDFMFMRTHKSYLVNLKYIKEIIPWFNHTYLLVMNGYEKDEVPVSRTYIKKFKSIMKID
ncbi:LytR/AlgR family response regulator transcription factor [Xylanivirga thermophila]|uniref:LytR/AlgR family response regulator transcription factor n=1 Tax=Xylanivirga thermophila TaxID=2496273 RepID=UPI00101C2148|nr:LytTR family DNA-binding domain-containing protein [Xylanivirga thermophila]